MVIGPAQQPLMMKLPSLRPCAAARLHLSLLSSRTFLLRPCRHGRRIAAG